ncbi:hypothetical protein KKC22_20225 [Myxococcota bacterium]|nr:hypothetical protein [Myxococcota bacterium]
MAAWFPRGGLWAVSFWFAALWFEGVVHRILLYELRPSHELEKIPPVFEILVPTATFFVYLSQILSFFLLFFFSVFILRAPTRVRFHRWMLSLILFFAFPALALNGLLIPTHMAGHLLWYYIGTISLLILTFLFLWHASLQFPTRRSVLFYMLLCSPSVLLIFARLLNPQAPGMPGTESWAGTLFSTGNSLFLFQGLLWPLLTPAGAPGRRSHVDPAHDDVRDPDILPHEGQITTGSTEPGHVTAGSGKPPGGGPRARPVPLAVSLGLTLAVALFFRMDSSFATSLWFAGWRVSLPLENFWLFLYFLSLWASFYSIAMLLSSRRRWRIFLGILLMCWIVTGFSPYQEMEVLPFLALMTLLAIGTAFSSVDEHPIRRPRFDPAPWVKALGTPLTQEASTGRPMTRHSGQIQEVPVHLDVFTLKDGRLGGLRLCIGEEPTSEPDWICCPISLVPLSRQFFPTLPRVSPLDESSCTQVAIWDRNFFSEDLLDDENLETARRLLLGEVSVWWGQCLTYEASYLPAAGEDQREFCRYLALIAQRAGIIEEPSEGPAVETQPNTPMAPSEGF